jgi:hypothetical protein
MSKLDLDLEAALKAAEARAPEPPPQPTSPLPRAKGRGKAKPSAEAGVTCEPKPAQVRRLAASRSGRVHMFSTRASAETLNALYALARDERRTVTELFEEAIKGLVEKSRPTR